MVVRRDVDIGTPFVARPRAVRPRVANARVRPARFGAGWAARGHSLARPLVAWMIRGYRQANAGDLAAAVAFNALVALVPTCLLLVSVAGLFLQQAQVLEAADRAILWALPTDQVGHALDLVIQARQNSGWFGAVSFLGFAWIGINFVTCLARSMNRIYGVPNRRFVHERLRGFIVIVVFATLFLMAAIAATVPTLFVQNDLPYYFRQWALAGSIGQVSAYAVAALTALVLFLVLYRVVPNAGQHVADVWPGALTAAFLFVLIAQVFPLYLRTFANYNRYGQVFGLVSLLVLWFYVLAHVLLFGTYVNATHHRRCHVRSRRYLGFCSFLRRRALTERADP